MFPGAWVGALDMFESPDSPFEVWDHKKCDLGDYIA
jgi:hypothetical protein